jgi:hypothetical protein
MVGSRNWPLDVLYKIFVNSTYCSTSNLYRIGCYEAYQLSWMYMQSNGPNKHQIWKLRPNSDVTNAESIRKVPNSANEKLLFMLPTEPYSNI